MTPTGTGGGSAKEFVSRSGTETQRDSVSAFRGAGLPAPRSRWPSPWPTSWKTSAWRADTAGRRTASLRPPPAGLGGLGRAEA